MPNRISIAELEDLRIDELGRRLRFIHAGLIRLTSGNGVCEVVLEEVSPCVLYAEIVLGRVMKFGTTDSLVSRQWRNANTISKILEFQDGRGSSRNAKITDPTTYDKYKQQAPRIIRDGSTIEIWATSLSSRAACQDPLKRFNAKCAACQQVEAALNKRYKTIEYGWATRLN
ncbi:MAG: hypothetical protein KJZ87_25280 [Thermoguttaceae bacterium]|nr:hypothetical protein [Thermoguttaceae bacterium]